MTRKNNTHHDNSFFNTLKEDLNAVDHIDELSREYRDFRDFISTPDFRAGCGKWDGFADGSILSGG